MRLPLKTHETRLLHGQTYTDDQWVRLGAATIADQLILAGEAPPFIIVFPDDRYWNLVSGPAFGARLVDALIPYIDATYRNGIVHIRILKRESSRPRRIEVKEAP